RQCPQEEGRRRGGWSKRSPDAPGAGAHHVDVARSRSSHMTCQRPSAGSSWWRAGGKIAAATVGGMDSMKGVTLPTETVFVMEMSPIKFGVGATDEIGYDARRLGLGRVLIVTDRHVAELGLPE